MKMYACKMGLNILLVKMLMIISVVPSLAQEIKKESKPEIMVLSMYHIWYSGSDVVNFKGEDVLNEKRQMELEDLISDLLEFNPTKIAVEHTSQALIDSLYRVYKKGEYNLKPSELDQISYPVAEQLGHEKVYAVDSKTSFPFNEVEAFAKDHGQENYIDQYKNIISNLVNGLQKKQQEGTIVDIVQYLNSKMWDSMNHSAYITLSQIGEKDNYIGNDLLAKWYNRNLNIFHNISKLAVSSKDRILVVYGAGHGPQLHQIIERNPNFELVSALDYLENGE